MAQKMVQDKVVVVTGAGGGIGRDMALALAAAGAKVVVNDIGTSTTGEGTDAGPAQKVVEELTAAGGQAVANMDCVAEAAAAGRIIQCALDHFGRSDGVVNNAGILRDRMLVNMTEQEWEAVIQVHLKGTFAPSRHAAAYWREKSKETGEPVGGRIVNTTSTSGIYGNMGQTIYGAAKAGIAAFTIIAARELRRIGVTVNAISPSAYTRMTEGLRELSEEELAARHPKWVAPAVVYLCSEEAEDLTGRIIQAGGGMVAVCEGWRRGAEMEQMADPSELGVHLREMCQKVRKNSDMDGMELD